MSRLGAINFFVIQWFGLRIAKSSEGTWGILLPVFPLTGWRTRYVPRGRYVPLLRA